MVSPQKAWNGSAVIADDVEQGLQLNLARLSSFGTGLLVLHEFGRLFRGRLCRSDGLVELLQ